MDLSQYLSIAISAVQEAAKTTSQIQKVLIDDDALIKKDKSPVTIADFAAQAIVCKELKKHFPQIPIVGEEDSGFLRKDENSILLNKINDFLPQWSNNEILDTIDMGNGKSGELFWTLDPVDGTKGFIRNDQYAVGLSLIAEGNPVVGVLGCANLQHKEKRGCLAYASSGSGAFIRNIDGENKNRLSVSTPANSASIRFLEGVEAGHSDHNMQESIMNSLTSNPQVVRYDSMVKYCVLARGEADVYLRLPNPKSPDYVENIWDHAAGVVIAKEAGGKISDMHGKELDFSQGKKLYNNRGVIVTNGIFHDDVVRVVNEEIDGK
jgi:3'(2'), 5'-bisphosphate nucleotidase